ncbi:lysoplasmalogenase family protein [Protaetiibacter intestinalis]|uniref:Lysoplasmalogenase n=1 Tax=Protaetiibacter intestinalis TaxID=2419774 RepID=A0A387BKE1_9MICO|nr:lysoplasmalogenase family protein [Protaetiibacter intestinalis]AYF98980.1 lysoplasmalogenase [Protaetiibacter intestinalis]
MRRVPLVLGAFAPFLAVSAFHLAVKLAGLVELDRATKGLTVPALILGVGIVLLIGRLWLPLPVLLTLLAGLVLSWIGDITLTDFVVGLSFFLAAHVAYMALFLVGFRRRPSWWSLGLLAWYAGLLVALVPSLGELTGIVAAYGAALALMAALSTRGNLFTMLGGTLFVASDSLLAFRLFTPLFQTPPEDTLIMGLYLAAQLCIVLGALRLATPRTPAARRDAEAAA